MKRLERKHPLAIRWFHWLNFPLVAAMIWSGTLIYWANAVYRIGFGRFTLLNPAWEHTLGFTIAELTAEPMLTFVHLDDQERVFGEFSR